LVLKLKFFCHVSAVDVLITVITVNGKPPENYGASPAM